MHTQVKLLIKKQLSKTNRPTLTGSLGNPSQTMTLGLLALYLYNPYTQVYIANFPNALRASISRGPGTTIKV